MKSIVLNVVINVSEKFQKYSSDFFSWNNKQSKKGRIYCV